MAPSFDPAGFGGPGDNPYTETEGGTMGCDSCPCQGLPSYSVDTAQLNLAVQDTDFAYEGLGPAVSITRTYNLDPASKGLFGASWRSTYESRITAGATTAILTKGSGQALSFTYTGTTTAGGVQTLAYTPPSGTFDTLTGYVNGSARYFLLKEKTTRYTYRYDQDPALTSSFRLTSITDRNGNALTVAYNADGTISAVTDAVGRATTFSYNANKLVTKVTTPDGASATYSYDVNGNMTGNVDLLGTVIGYTYDAGNFMTTMTVSGKTVSFGYDSSGGWKHISKVTDADGNVRQYAGIATGSTTSTDGRQNKTTYASAAGKTTGVTNALGKTWSTTFANGLPATRTDANGNVSSMEYDARGNLTRYTDPTGSITRFTYDADSNVLSMTTALGETWTYGYDAKGNLTSMLSPGGKKSTRKYDGKGNVVSVTDPQQRTTTYTYDPNRFYRLASVTDARGKVTSFGYDTAGLNLTSVTDPGGFVTAFAYDRNRRLTKTTHPDGASRSYGFDATAMTSLTDELGKTTVLTRDNRLNVTRITDPLQREFRSAFDANSNLSSVTDPLQRVRSYTYDAADRLARSTDAQNTTISLARDGNGNVTAVSDEKNKQTTFAYDRRDLPTSVADPLGNKVSRTYDALGRLSQLTNARGATIGFTYNADGWRTGKSWGGASVATYGYDNAGNLITTTDSGGTTTYSYDAANHVTGIVYPDGKALAQTFDDNGNVKTMTYPGGLVVTYSYDSRNRLQRMAWGANAIDLTYDATGKLLTETRSNGTQSTYAYDAAGQLVALTHKKGAVAIADLAYTRNAAGLVTGESGVFPLPLPAIAGSDITATYGDAHGITAWGADNYSYDADGNLTAIAGTRTFSAVYDNENRPTSIRIGSATTTYGYDALGNRVKSQTGTVTRNFHHGVRGRLLFETDGAGQVTASHLYVGARLVASINSAGGFVFYHHDKTGNTLALTDSSGAVAGAFAYSPYGELLASSGSVTTPFKYVGAFGVMDEGGGIHFMKNRYYDANTGRFLQRDPIGFAGGQTNLYGYVRGDPVARVDPTGLRSDETLGVDPGSRYNNLYDPAVVKAAAQTAANAASAADVALSAMPKLGKAWSLIKMPFNLLTMQQGKGQSDAGFAAEKLWQFAFDVVQLINPFDTVGDLLQAAPLGETEDEIRQAREWMKTHKTCKPD